MDDWISRKEREELRAYNERRYKQQHGLCIMKIEALKQENERLRDGLARIKELSPGDSIAWMLAYEALFSRPYSHPSAGHPTGDGT